MTEYPMLPPSTSPISGKMWKNTAPSKTPAQKLMIMRKVDFDHILMVGIQPPTMVIKNTNIRKG